jgi:methylated-DNA-[protein]-cysteine S-methyltransferase
MHEKRYYAIFNTAAGWIGLLGSAAGPKRITLPQSSRKQAISALGTNVHKAVPSQIYFKDLINRLQEYFTGQRVDFSDKLDLSQGTAFQRSVWKATRQIPRGQTRSYSQIARQIGKPGAARAVGQALGKNPLPVFIPCHRVVKSDGSLGGFTGGLAMKRRLLSLEKQSG